MIPPDKIEKKVGNYVRGKINSLNNSDIERIVDNYRKNITQKFIPKEELNMNDIPIKEGAYVSVKYDGEFNVFCYERDKFSFFMNTPNHRVIYGLPVNEDLNQIMEDKHIQKAYIVGELIAAASGDFTEYGRVYDFISLSRAPENEDELKKIGFRVFDIITLNDLNLVESKTYEKRISFLKRIIGFDEEKPLSIVKTAKIKEKEALKTFFEVHVKDRNAEGIVVRLNDGSNLVYKVKSLFSIDVVLIGMVNGNHGSRITKEQTASTLVALRYPDGLYQILGKCGGGLSDEDRTKLWSEAQFVQRKGFTETTSDGRAYQMVKPQKVLKIKYNDILETRSNMEHINKNVLQYDEHTQTWKIIKRVPFVAIRHPRFTEDFIRYDKSVDIVEDVRVEQILQRTTALDDLEIDTEEMSKSEILKKIIYRSDEKVRKLLLIKTNKENFGYLPYIIYYIYYTPEASKKVIRKAKGVKNEKMAYTIFDEMREEEMDTAGNPKRGWTQIHKF